MDGEMAVPVWYKLTLTLEEAAAYSGVGIKKLRELSSEDNDFVMYINSKRVINRRKLEKYLETNKYI